VTFLGAATSHPLIPPFELAPSCLQELARKYVMSDGIMLRSRWAWLCSIALAFGCGQKTETTCPEETKVHVVEGSAGKRRVCLLEDGITAHGPVVDIDEHGREHLVGRVIRGKREGRWVESNPLLGTKTEISYRDGRVDGRFTVSDSKGKLVAEQEFRDGHPHGKRMARNVDGSLQSVEYYENGKPTGTWEVHTNGAVEKRVYGSDGVLVLIDGRNVPPPPLQLELTDGRTLTRAECIRRAEAFQWDGVHPSVEPLCLDVFEQVQRCADDDCRRRSIDDLARRR